MRALVYGVGAVGARVARQLASTVDLTELYVIDADADTAQQVATSIGAPAKPASIAALRLESRVARFAELCSGLDLVVLTAPADQAQLAHQALRDGAHVVSVSDDVDTIEELRALDTVARERGRLLLLGAGFSPGLSCLLARHAGSQFDVVDEVYVAKYGTGGPECARQHHRSLRSEAAEWRDGSWQRRHGGTGRELCWFPDPVGGQDCYWGALPDVSLLLPAFPGVVRAAARIAATRRDQMTKWLPMLRRPHPEGLLGAIRVEVRGWVGTQREVVIYGALDRPAVAAATVAAVAGQWAAEGRLDGVGALGLAELMADPVPMLHELAERGVRAAAFEGMHRAGIPFAADGRDG